MGKIFNKLKQVQTKMNAMYFGKMKVRDWGRVPVVDSAGTLHEDDTCPVWVRYEDETHESMTAEEWKCASDAPVEDKDLLEFNIKRLNAGAVGAVLGVLQKENVRISDLGDISKRVEDSINEYIKSCYKVRYGSERIFDWKIGQVMKAMEEAGYPFEKMTGNPLGEKVWTALTEDEETTFETLQRALIYVQNSWNQLNKGSQEAVLQTKAHVARLSDIMAVIREGEGKGTFKQDNSSNEQGDVQNTEDTEQAPVGSGEQTDGPKTDDGEKPEVSGDASAAGNTESGANESAGQV